MCLGDALDDCQAEADACVVGAYAFGAAKKRLGKRGDRLRGELLAGVLDGEHRTPGVNAGRDPHGAVFRQVVDDRVLHEVRRQLQQERVRADGGGHVAGGLDGEAAFLGEGEERLGGLFRDEGQVDVLAGEGPSVGAAEQEQCFGEVDRPGVDGVEAVDELARVAVRIVAGDVEKCLRDRQRGAQLVGGIGCESLLFGDVCFEPGEHGVEGVGELAELVSAAFELDSVGERSVRGGACGVRDASQRGEHAAGEEPPSQETEDQQERQHDGRGRSESAQELGVAAHQEDHAVGAHHARGRSTRRRAARTPASMRKPA